MADEHKSEGGMSDAMWLLAVLAILVTLWYFSGGPERADLRGIFLSPPSPLGTGEAYGPQLGTSTAETPENDPYHYSTDPYAQ